MVPQLTDRSLIWFGKYKGYALANIPAEYLLWIYDNLKIREDLKRYIDDHRKILQQEKKLSQKNCRR